MNATMKVTFVVIGAALALGIVCFTILWATSPDRQRNADLKYSERSLIEWCEERTVQPMGCPEYDPVESVEYYKDFPTGFVQPQQTFPEHDPFNRAASDFLCDQGQERFCDG